MPTHRRVKQDGVARIGDVARQAGVSTATVSRALSVPEQVRPELRARVAEAVKALGYTPNAAARSLRAGQTRMILVITRQRWSAPFFSEVLNGIDAELALAGYSMIMGNFDLGDDRESYIAEMMFSGHIDGAIVLSGILASSGGRSMLSSGLPIVSICAAVEGTYAVLTNEGDCIVAAARHLVDLGHQDFLYISGPDGTFNEMMRRAALESFFTDPSRTGLRLRRLGGDFTTGSGVDVAGQFLAMAERPTAVISCNDEMAVGFMKTVRGKGVRVPGEVSVVGFDGIELADYCEPTLTTIRQPRYALGQIGARVLIEALTAGTPLLPAVRYLPSELAIRHSTAARPD